MPPVPGTTRRAAGNGCRRSHTGPWVDQRRIRRCACPGSRRRRKWSATRPPVSRSAPAPATTWPPQWVLACARVMSPSRSARPGPSFCVTDMPAADPSGSVAGFCDATGDYLPLVATVNAARVLAVVGDLLGVDHAEFGRLALSASAGCRRPHPAAVPGRRTNPQPAARHRCPQWPDIGRHQGRPGPRRRRGAALLAGRCR